MVQEKGNKQVRIAMIAALLLAAGVAQADIVTGAGAGAGPDRTVKSGGKGTQKGGVSVAVGDINGDGQASKPVAPIAPIKSPAPPKPLPQGPANIQATPKKPQEALLVPAVQKVREAASRSK
jgi:hypothetical protein